MPYGFSVFGLSPASFLANERTKFTKFQRTLSVVEGRDQRLDNSDGAIVGAGIAPGFEFVRGVGVPLA